MRSFKQIGLCAVVAVAAFSQYTLASVPWTTPNGSAGSVSYSNGQSENGYFGDPTILSSPSGTSFNFTPVGFIASASNGGAQSTSDKLSVDLAGVNGATIQTISFHVFGDWSILGATGLVKEAGALFLTELAGTNPGQTFSANENVTYTPSFGPNITSNDPNVLAPHNPSGTSDGLFDGFVTINLPAGVTSVRLVLNDILQAAAGPGSTAFIQKKGVGAPQGSEIIINGNMPEPASMSVLLLGGVALLRRRRATV